MKTTLKVIAITILASLLSSCHSGKIYRHPEQPYTPLFAEGRKVELNSNLAASGSISLNAYTKIHKNFFAGASLSTSRYEDTGGLDISIGIWPYRTPPRYLSAQLIASASFGITNLLKKNFTVMGTLGQRTNTTVLTNYETEGPESIRFNRYAVSIYKNHYYKKGGGFQFGLTSYGDFVNEIVSFEAQPEVLLNEAFIGFIPFAKFNTGGKFCTFNTSFFWEFTNRKLTPMSSFQASMGLTFSLGKKKKKE